MTLYPWPGTEGVWVIAAIVLLLWWLAIAGRLETTDHAAIGDAVGTPERLQQLIEDEAGSEPGL